MPNPSLEAPRRAGRLSSNVGRCDARAQSQIVQEETMVTDYSWRPIAPLSAGDRQIDLAAMRPLYDTWRVSKDRLEQSSPASLRLCPA
jgi:hypothetical protein